MATEIGTYLKYGCGCLFAVHFGLPILVVFVVLIWLSVTEPFSAATAIGFSLVPLMGGGILAMGVGKGVSFDHETGRWMGMGGKVLLGFGAVSLITAMGLVSAPSGSFSFEGQTPPEGGMLGPVEVNEDMWLETRVEQTLGRESGTFQHWSFVTIELLDEQKKYLSSFGGEVWREAGRDSDGRWEEADPRYEATLHMVSAGTYYLRVQTESNVGPVARSPIHVTLTEPLWWGNPDPLRNAAYLAFFVGIILVGAPGVGSHPSRLVQHLDEGVRVRYGDRSWVVRDQVHYRYETWVADEWTLHPTGPGANRPRYLEREYEEESDWEEWFISRPVDFRDLRCAYPDGDETDVYRFASSQGSLPEVVRFEDRRYAIEDTGEARRDEVPVPYHNYESAHGHFLTIEGTVPDEADAVVGHSISPSAVSIEEKPKPNGRDHPYGA